jgi:hypothetical protein
MATAVTAVLLELLLGLVSKALQCGIDAEHHILPPPCGHVHRDAVVALIIADLHLDVLPAAIRSADPMLVDMLIDGLSFRTAA